jgi:hypothetical protein
MPLTGGHDCSDWCNASRWDHDSNGGTNNEVISALLRRLARAFYSFSLYYKVTSGTDTFTVPAGVYARLRATIGSGVYSNGTTVIYTVAAGFITVTPGASITITNGGRCWQY